MCDDHMSSNITPFNGVPSKILLMGLNIFSNQRCVSFNLHMNSPEITLSLKDTTQYVFLHYRSHIHHENHFHGKIFSWEILYP